MQQINELLIMLNQHFNWHKAKMERTRCLFGGKKNAWEKRLYEIGICHNEATCFMIFLRL
jgi:hypothetical protein